VILILVVCNFYAVIHVFELVYCIFTAVFCKTKYITCVSDFVDIFEPFLKAYVNEFKFKSITTDDWKQFLYRFFDDKVISAMFAYISIYLLALHVKTN